MTGSALGSQPLRGLSQNGVRALDQHHYTVHGVACGVHLRTGGLTVRLKES